MGKQHLGYSPVSTAVSVKNLHAHPSSHAGSIPVFIGPPFNAMPLSHLLDYNTVGLVFNITGPTPWIGENQPQMLELPSDAPESSFKTPLQIVQVMASFRQGFLGICHAVLASPQDAHAVIHGQLACQRCRRQPNRVAKRLHMIRACCWWAAHIDTLMLSFEKLRLHHKLLSVAQDYFHCILACMHALTGLCCLSRI